MKKKLKKALIPSKKTHWGQVLWWDARDGEGIIKDWNSNKIYFDSSVITLPELASRITPGRFVTFRMNEAITTTLCACFVGVPKYPVEKEKRAA